MKGSDTTNYGLKKGIWMDMLKKVNMYIILTSEQPFERCTMSRLQTRPHRPAFPSLGSSRRNSSSSECGSLGGVTTDDIIGHRGAKINGGTCHIDSFVV